MTSKLVVKSRIFQCIIPVEKKTKTLIVYYRELKKKITPSSILTPVIKKINNNAMHYYYLRTNVLIRELYFL